MRRLHVEPAAEYEELRRLLVSREREQIRELRERISDKESRSRDIASVLPEAIILSRERGEELTRALRPAVDSSIRESIELRPDTYVEALHPIIGPMVRRSIAESLRRLLQSLNQTLEHTFSWRGLKWRFEAWRTGRSFAEVVMLRSLVYRVEQLFLIHRQTSMLLLHATADASLTKDSDMVAGMLSAIQDFVRDAFATGQDSALEEFRVGDLQVWIAPERHAYLAAVIRGNPPRELRTTLDEAIESIHVLKGSALAKFSGDAAEFESLRPELDACLRAQYATAEGKRKTGRAWLVILVAAALMTAALVVFVRGKLRWNDFVRALAAQPGIVVTGAERHWFSPSEINGLRDATAPADPAAIAREARVNPARVRFEWKDFLALDPASVRRRIEQRFGIPPGGQVVVADGVVTVTGTVPYEWLEHLRREGTLVAGVRSIADGDAQITYDPRLARERFEAQLGLPEGVRANVSEGVLKVSGEASHHWLTRLRALAPSLPGITAVDDAAVVDLDERAFQQSKSVIESAFVYFLVNKDNIATEGFAALSRLPEELRRCVTAAKRLGQEVALEIRGYADPVGNEALNLDLSRRRAARVREFLVGCGFEAGMLNAVPMGVHAAVAPGGPPLPDDAERRVEFKVTAHPPPP